MSENQSDSLEFPRIYDGFFRTLLGNMGSPKFITEESTFNNKYIFPNLVFWNEIILIS